MKTIIEVKTALNSIRTAVDAPLNGVDDNGEQMIDINKVQEKAVNLTMLFGLSAETKASSKKILHTKELEVLKRITKEALPPSTMTHMLRAECFDELAMLEYADRLNAAITHSLDTLRSVISLYKQEIANSIK